MSNNSNNIIDQLTEKLKHTDIEISTRAIKNFDLKLKTKLFSFQNFSQFQIENLITNLFLLIRINLTKGGKNTDLDTLSKALQLMKESLAFTSNNFRQSLRNNNLLAILSEISQAMTDGSIQSICNSIIELIVNEENYLQINHDKNPLNQTNSFCADIKGNTITEKHFSTSLNCNSSQYTNKSFKKSIQGENLNSNKNFPQIKIFNLLKSFPEVCLNQREEQVFFDTNINLKFGDYLQISKNLYEVYYSLMQDYPVEYFLQNSDLVKSILILIDKTDFNEYGVILMKILDRMYFLIRKKIEFYKEGYTKITTGVSLSRPDMNHYSTCLNFVYPPVDYFLPNINSMKTDITSNISVRDYLVMSIQSLIQAMYDEKKLPFYFNLLEKYFEFLTKIIFLSNISCKNSYEGNEHMAIIYDILTRLHPLVQYYFNYTDIDHGKITYKMLCKFFIQILTNLDEDYCIQLLAFYTPDVINLIKDIIFIFEDSKEKLVDEFIKKLSSIILSLQARYNKNISKSNTTSSYSTSTDFKLMNELKNLIDDLQNSDKIRNCIEIFTYFRHDIEKEKLNPSITIDYEKFLNNFDEILIAFKYFLETERNSENFETTIQKFSFMKILCGAFYGYKSQDRNGKNSRLALVTKCFLKLLSFLNTLAIQADYKFKLFIYRNIYTQLLEDGEGSEIISKIIYQDLSTFFLILNEISQCQSAEEHKTSFDIDPTPDLNNSLESLLNEIIHTMLQQALLNNIPTVLACYSALLPLKLSNTKHRSLHIQIDNELTGSISGRINVFMKYLRLIFSRSEMIRLNCINYFRLFDESGVMKSFKTIEFVNFSINYNQLKQGDIVYLIQSAEKEIPNLIKNIKLNSNIDIELIPLLNIFYSNKIEFNLKASTIEQMCYLIDNEKYRIIFLEVFEFSIEKINEFFSQNFKREDKNFVENDKMNYIQNLLKLIILIIIFYKKENTVKQFISMELTEDTVNKNLLNMISSLLKILFNENLQNKNKHMLGVYSITFLFLIAFNSDNFCEEISSCLHIHKLSNDHQREKNNLTLYIPKIFQGYYYLDFVPNKLVCLLSKDREELNDINFLKLIDHTCNRYTLLYIRSKDEHDEHNGNDKEISKRIDPSAMKTAKSSLKSLLKDYAGKAPNYLQIYLALSSFFSNIVNDCDIYDKYAEEFLIIFSFFKKLTPIRPEEKNLISDFLALFNTFAGMSNIAIDYSPTVLKSMNDILENYIAFITLSAGHKQFVEGLNRPWAENQIFLIELCNCLINNEIIFKNKNFSFILRNRRLIYKFFETFNNILIFDEGLKAIRLLIIKAQIIYYDVLVISRLDCTKIESEPNGDLSILFQKFLLNSLNTFDFYLGKYNISIETETSSNDNNGIGESFIDIRLITKILEYINIIAESACNNAYVYELIYKKSFTIMKYLNTKFLDLNLLSLQIFKNLLKNLHSENIPEDKEPTIADFFTKHSTLLSTVYENIISISSNSNFITPFIYLINQITFLNFSLEKFSKLKEDSEFYSDFLLMNEKLLDESQLTFLLLLVDKNLEKNSLFCACVLKLISNLLNLNPNFYENFFLNTNFYETGNEIFRREKEKIMREKLFDEEKILQFEFCDKNFEKKLFYKNKIESLLNINEGLFLVIKSFTKVEKKFLFDSENIYHRNRMILNEIFINAFYLAEEVKNLTKKFESERNFSIEFNFSIFFSENIKIDIFEDFAVKYFTLLNFLFHMEKNFIFQNILGNLSGEKFDDKQNFFDTLVDLLKFEKKKLKNSEKQIISEIEILEIPLSFAKILPYIFELIIKINSDSGNNSSSNLNSLGNLNFIKLKNEGEILLILMTAFNSVYKTKTDTIFSKSQNNSHNIKYKFDLKNDSDISNKNILIQSISSILSTSQNCKKIFIKSNFINVFIDYVSQISEILLEINLNRNSSQNKNNFTFANKNATIKTNAGNIINVNNIISSQHQYNEEFLVSEMKNVLILFCNLLYKFEDCEEKDSLYAIAYENYPPGESKKKEKNSQNNFSFLNLLSEIFYEVIRTPILFENYLKVLMNLVSKNDQAKKSFTLNLNSSEKETFLFLILDYFNKNFLNLNSNPNFELFIKFLKCLFQNKAVVLYLQKIKFVENLLKDFETLIVNKKHIQNLKFIEQILNLLISLSFEAEISKKMISKELIENLSNFILKVKNENVIYNTLFLFRNFCFVPSNKTHFLVNENLFGSIFAFLSGTYSIRIKFILSHLIWVLLYNNQTLKGILCRDEFKTELTSVHIHLQKENDARKYLKDSSGRLDTQSNKLIEESCLNFRKILHIIEI